ncbi:MAG: MerC domain-containing protein [Planctomycetota bacterium]|nr:MerC domain-containing protein [Planctomycetota bacterium]
MELTIGQQTTAAAKTTTWQDWLGIIASIACAVHCAAMPFVIAYLPALGLSFLADEVFHKWMALVCFLIAIIAFIPGLFRHRSWVPVSIGSVGLLFITCAAFGMAGDCCAACSGESEVPGTAESETSCCDEPCEHCESASETSVTVESEASCCDESCEDCESADGLQDLDDASGEKPIENASFFTQFATWITPIGGVLLVTAHLMNRRLGCDCRCCTTTPAESTVSLKPFDTQS